MARGLAYQQQPDPSWGRQLVGADVSHLAHLDALVSKTVRRHRIISLAGLAALLAGYATVRLTGGLAAQGTSVVGILMAAGLIGLLGGLWIPWRLSFAVHRMWGIYERGIVAPFYIKGGLAALVPWEDISVVKLRRMRGSTADPYAEVFLFRIEERRNAYAIHRIWESVLQQWFGYPPSESVRFREEILAALRHFLAPEQIVVETEFEAP